jgi:hypothetical protein
LLNYGYEKKWPDFAEDWRQKFTETGEPIPHTLKVPGFDVPDPNRVPTKLDGNYRGKSWRPEPCPSRMKKARQNVKKAPAREKEPKARKETAGAGGTKESGSSKEEQHDEVSVEAWEVESELPTKELSPLARVVDLEARLDVLVGEAGLNEDDLGGKGEAEGVVQANNEDPEKESASASLQEESDFKTPTKSKAGQRYVDFVETPEEMCKLPIMHEWEEYVNGKYVETGLLSGEKRCIGRKVDGEICNKLFVANAPAKNVHETQTEYHPRVAAPAYGCKLCRRAMCMPCKVRYMEQLLCSPGGVTKVQTRGGAKKVG